MKYLQEIKAECVGYLNYVFQDGRSLFFVYSRLPKVVWICGRLGFVTYLLETIECEDGLRELNREDGNNG